MNSEAGFHSYQIFPHISTHNALEVVYPGTVYSIGIIIIIIISRKVLSFLMHTHHRDTNPWKNVLEVETLKEKGKEGNSSKGMILPIKDLTERKPGFSLGSA